MTVETFSEQPNPRESINLCESVIIVKSFINKFRNTIFINKPIKLLETIYSNHFHPQTQKYSSLNKYIHHKKVTYSITTKDEQMFENE